MRDLLSWNVSLGRWRWAGVHVRLHVFFIVFAIVALFLCTESQSAAFWYVPASLFILIGSVLLHELGHCYGARRVGGRVDQLLLWPLGGLIFPNVPHQPQPELLTALAGPMVNAIICLLVTPFLVFWRVPLTEVINPFSPPAAASGISWKAGVELVFWTNWVLLAVNLLPASPLDGSRILRALLWPSKGYRTSVILVSRAAKLSAIAMWILAWVIYDTYTFAWMPLSLLGLFLFFSGKQEAERLHEPDLDDAPFGYDFSQGYTSLERDLESDVRHRPSLVKKWLEQRREQRALRQRQLEEEEDRRVDDILVRLHEVGQQGLSADERALLQRVSQRYRNRQQH
jgi:Zn-dependent protease